MAAPLRRTNSGDFNIMLTETSFQEILQDKIKQELESPSGILSGYRISK